MSRTGIRSVFIAMVVATLVLSFLRGENASVLSAAEKQHGSVVENESFQVAALRLPESHKTHQSRSNVADRPDDGNQDKSEPREDIPLDSGTNDESENSDDGNAVDDSFSDTISSDTFRGESRSARTSVGDNFVLPFRHEGADIPTSFSGNLTAWWRIRSRPLCPEGTQVMRLIFPHVNKAGGRTIESTFKPDANAYYLQPAVRTRKMNVTLLGGHHGVTSMLTILSSPALLQYLYAKPQFAHLTHNIMGDQPQLCTRWIGLLRHPVDRSLSAFNTMVGRSSSNRGPWKSHFKCKDRKVRKLMRDPSFTIEDLANLSEDIWGTCKQNYHVRYFAGDNGTLEQAKSVLSQMAFVGILEEFPLSMQLLNWELDMGLKLYTPLSNRNYYEKKTEISTKARRMLVELNREDLELYWFAKNQLFQPRVEAMLAYYNGIFPWVRNGLPPSTCDKHVLCWDKRHGPQELAWNYDDPIPPKAELASIGEAKENVLCSPRKGCKLN